MTHAAKEPSKTKPIPGLGICPHIGMADDPQTQYISHDIQNTCYQAQPPNRISLRHQIKMCLTRDFCECPVYQAEAPGPLPRELQGRSHRPFLWEPRARVALLILSVLALLALAYFVWCSGSRSTASAAGTPVVPEAVMPLVIRTATDLPRPTPVRPSRTPQASETPEVTETETPVQITPGPALETPFGGDRAYLVHLTLEGETLEVLAARYNTSVPVLQVVNLPPGQQGIWANLPVVVLPGQRDAADLTRMQAVLIEADTSVADLVARFRVDEADFRLENGLHADLVPGGRWVVMHVE
jgi:hypothetical protein